MKFPLTPPDHTSILRTTTADPDLHARIVSLGPTDPKGRYLHWDKLRHLEPPSGMTSEQWWSGMKAAREQMALPLPFVDTSGNSFWFCTTPETHGRLHWLDIHTRTTASPGLKYPIAATLLPEHLAEEAISSSQLEGAGTSSREARNMLRMGRPPRDKGERMIANNYLAMQFIQDIKDDPLTPDMLFELHRILTENTLDEPGRAGRFRTDSDDICVVDDQRRVLHVPPPASELPSRLKSICAFANQQKNAPFIHPVIRAIILHFMLAYDHPFVDGNGRTARALFYKAVAEQGYELLGHLSISSVLKKTPTQYARAFLLTETDGNDVTYFIDHHLRVLAAAVEELEKDIEHKQLEAKNLEAVLPDDSPLRARLNSRQLAVVQYGLHHPGHMYTIREHQRLHGIVYETARKDLLTLADQLGLLLKVKEGKRFVVVVPNDLGRKIRSF